MGGIAWKGDDRMGGENMARLESRMVYGAWPGQRSVRLV